MPKWIAVDSESMPPTLHPVLIAFIDGSVPQPTDVQWARAVWVPDKTVESNLDHLYEGDDIDYDEDEDRYCWPEGWYEWNNYEDTHWRLTPHVTVLYWAHVELPGQDYTEAPNKKRQPGQ